MFVLLNLVYEIPRLLRPRFGLKTWYSATAESKALRIENIVLWRDQSSKITGLNYSVKSC